MLTRHPRVHSGQHRHGRYQHEERVHQPDCGAQPPSHPTPALEGGGVDGGEDPTVYEVRPEAHELCPVPIGRQHRPSMKGRFMRVRPSPWLPDSIVVNTTVPTNPQNETLRLFTRDPPMLFP